MRTVCDQGRKPASPVPGWEPAPPTCCRRLMVPSNDLPGPDKRNCDRAVRAKITSTIPLFLADPWSPFLGVPSLAGLGQPVLETQQAEPGIVDWRERLIDQLGAEIAGMDVGGDSARVVRRDQIFPTEFIEAAFFRAGQLDDAVNRSAECDVGKGRGDIVRSHGLKQGGRQPDDLSIGRGLDDPADEFEEL